VFGSTLEGGKIDSKRVELVCRIGFASRIIDYALKLEFGVFASKRVELVFTCLVIL
jgi:hypothetical protein